MWGLKPSQPLPLRGPWFLHRSYMRAKQNGGLLLREKQARQLSTCLSKPLTAQRCSHRLIEPSNHGTIERKISNRSRIWSVAGWCPAAINIDHSFVKKKPRLFHFEGFQRRKILKDFINYCSWWSSAFHYDHFSFYLVINLLYVYVIFSFYVTPSM